jgi:hypothetical protein
MLVPRHFHWFLCALWVSGLTFSVRTKAQVAKPPTAKTPSIAERYFAQSRITQEAQGPEKNKFRYSFLFPTKATAEITITVNPNQFYKPTAKESKLGGAGAKVYALKITGDPNTNKHTLSYFVPYSSLSPSAVRQIRGMAGGSAVPNGQTAGPRLRLAAYATREDDDAGSYGTQEPDTGSGEGQGEEGASVATDISEGSEAVEQVVALLKSVGLEAEALQIAEIVSDLASSGVRDFKIWALGSADRALVEQILSYRYCVYNLPLLDIKPLFPRFNPALDQTSADSVLSSVDRNIDDQLTVSSFQKLVAWLKSAATEELPFLPLVTPLAGDPLGAEQADLSQSLAQLLAEIRSMAPYCSGTWSGTFQVIGSAPSELMDDHAQPQGLSGPTTYSDSGTVHFSITNGLVKGTIDGALKFNVTFPELYGCTGSPSYSGLLYGQVDQLGNANVTTTPTSPHEFNLSCTGPMCDELSGGKCAPMPRGMSSWGFNIDLSGQRPSYDMYTEPFNAPLRAAGFKRHITITVHKLQ